MPGIELIDYYGGKRITPEIRDGLIEAVHHSIKMVTGKKPKHSSFKYTQAGPLDTSGYRYILVVDGEWTEATNDFKKEIHELIKVQAMNILAVGQTRLAVRYRLFNSAFG